MNWEALDALIIDFAKSEHLIEEFNSTPPPSPQSSPSPSPSSSPSSSSYRSRVLILQIRQAVECGDIDAAVTLLRSQAPVVLDDHRLLFRLHKQKFIELLRKGTQEARDAAIYCTQKALAPCALDAYPEAYEEFKHVLLALIYDKDDQTSPVAHEWSERRRFEIAGLLSSVLRDHLQAYDPVFSMTLRYLISIHKVFCFRQGVPSPISDLTERLLLEERDSPATPQESLWGAPPFDEVDIQALAHAVELTRQGAIDSLRFAKGDLFRAFQNELCRMQLNVPLLDNLVHEYCVYRGIVDLDTPLPSGATRNRKVSGGEGSSSIQLQDTDTEERYPGEVTSGSEDCSTSGTHQSKSFKILPKSRGHVSGERNKRKRWRGRGEELNLLYNVHPGSDMEVQTAGNTDMLMVNLSQVDSINKMENSYEFLLKIKDLASRGMAAEVVEELNSVETNFMLQNPVLLFQLKQVEFLKLVRSGDHSRALSVASTHLGPLAADNVALLKPLKETLLALLRPDEEAFNDCLPLHALATSLQVAVGRKLGIEEPQLMKIVRETVHTHTEWFKQQMCNDRFEGFLKINSVKEVTTPLLASGAYKSNSDTGTHGSSEVTVSSGVGMQDGNSPTQSSSDDTNEESAIIKVMEFLALPRADAIHLLAQYSGNAEAVIQQIFA